MTSSATCPQRHTPDAAMDCLTVAASGAITDYSDIVVRGYLKEHPDCVAYRLALLTKMIEVVRAACIREQGEWGLQNGPDVKPPEVDHHEQVAQFAQHTCNCEWCFHATSEIPAGECTP